MDKLVIFYVLMAITAIFGPMILVWVKALDKSVNLFLLVFFLICIPTIIVVGYAMFDIEEPKYELLFWTIGFFVSWQVNHRIKLRRIRSRKIEGTSP